MSGAGRELCPVCTIGLLADTGDRVDLPQVLRRWHVEAGISFDGPTLAHYAAPGRCIVRLHRCAACGFAPFLPPVPGTESFYEAITGSEERYYVAGRWEFEQAIRDLRRARVRRVLDVGCGSGHFLELLRTEMPDVESVGVEFNPKVAELARQRGHRVLAGPGLDTIRAAGGGFDAICAFQVIEHVGAPMEFVEALRDALAPGARLVLSVPDADGPVRHFDTALTDIPPHHVSRWRAATFRTAMPRLGLQVLRTVTEPLPEYLWESYLPVMIEQDWLSPRLASRLRIRSLLPPAIAALRRLGLRRLWGVRGLALYALLAPVEPALAAGS